MMREFFSLHITRNSEGGLFAAFAATRSATTVKEGRKEGKRDIKTGREAGRKKIHTTKEGSHTLKEGSHSLQEGRKKERNRRPTRAPRLQKATHSEGGKALRECPFR
jgi:hypothetical protein